MTTASNPTETLELLITRRLNAPRELVFRVWTQREHMLRWWRPNDFTTTACEVDIRPGGGYRICIRTSEGEDYWMVGTYREVTPPERLVFTHAWVEDNGETTPETLITVTFTEENGQTEVSFHQTGFQSAASRDSHEKGWSEFMAHLSQYLQDPAARENLEDRDIVISRDISAPRELVFRAWTEPEHIIQWWGPKGFTTTSKAIDIRPGGSWRFTMHSPDGVDFENQIVFTEIRPPELIRYAHGDGGPEPHFHSTVTFEELDGKTRLTLCLHFPTAEARNETARFGAVEGGYSTLERLEEYLPKISA